jgi:hypothetical protein
MSELVNIFIDNFQGLAFVTSISSDEILYNNSSHKAFCLQKDSSINALIENSTSPLIEANLRFCNFVNNKLKSSLSPTFAKELYDGEKYISLRLLIDFEGVESMLVLISDCNADPLNDNQNIVYVSSI